MKKLILALFCCASFNAVAGGNIAAGEALAKKYNCAACHGADFNKPIDPSYPKLAGQHADYLFVSLKSYQIERNANVGRGNAVMGTQARMFTHAELKQLAAYIATLPGDLRTVPQSRFR